MHITLLHFTALFFLSGISAKPRAYPNDFIDPKEFLSKTLGAYTHSAQATVLEWADTYAAGGPWSVTYKKLKPPSGDMHDYMSFAPYWWPQADCLSKKKNLKPEQIWTECPYVVKDGKVNPDTLLVPDFGAFQNMSEAVLYNTIAWTFGTPKNSTFEANAVRFIRTFFLDAATKMNPNVNYGQMRRGHAHNVGSHTGLMKPFGPGHKIYKGHFNKSETKALTKIVSAILLLREAKSSAWTTDLDNQMITWSKAYITWIQTAPIALTEEAALNNHATFYYNQLGAMQILVGDLAGATKSLNTFFDGKFMTQIKKNGEQPLEAARTRSFHYRTFNLCGLITNGRLLRYADPSSNPWIKKTKEGATIKTALDFTMSINPAKTHENPLDLTPSIAAVGAIYGDEKGTYAAFVKNGRPRFMDDPYILWNQPWASSTSGTPAAP
ncbi:hypothetical protein BYT27DRAFT_7115572 [Phlegmacium glaucopus]|nr:hypothetical protein BYT27DRAFT_7115572 [Phlegmacium glaucopus]